MSQYLLVASLAIASATAFILVAPADAASVQWEVPVLSSTTK